MAFTEFFEKRAQERAYGQNMDKLGQTRDGFLRMLVENGAESTHSWGDVIYDRVFEYSKIGRTMTTVTLGAVGDWTEGHNFQVEISTIVSKIKLQQLQLEGKKPIVHIKLTLDGETTRYAIPNDVTNSYAYKYKEYLLGNSDEMRVGNELYCVGLVEVMEHVQAGKLAVVKR